MAWAVRGSGGEWAELFGPFTIGTGSAAVQYPPDWPARATTAERAAAGIFSIEEAAGPRPAGPVKGLTITGADRPVRQWEIDPAALQAWLIDQIDAIAALLRHGVITVAAGQEDEYRRKKGEIDKGSTLGGSLTAIGTALNLLPPAQQRAAYPLLSIEKDAMGFASLGEAYAFVSNKIAVANPALDAITRARRLGKVAVRAASTAAAKRAAYDAISWPAPA